MIRFLYIVWRLHCFAASLVLLLAVGVRPAQAEPSAPATQVAVLNPSQDATIDSLNPLVNFGKMPDLHVAVGLDQTENRYELDALLRFDLSSIPLGANITSATLNMRLTEGAGRTLVAAHSIASAWAETTVTFKDRPTVANLPLFSQDVPIDPKPRQVIFDVKKLVSSWVNDPTQNFGMGLRSTTTGIAARRFDSREGGAAPVLTIQYTLPPIRVCRDQVDPCTPLDGATVTKLTGVQAQFATTDGGLVQDGGSIQLNDRLWVKYLLKSINRGLGLYCVTPQPVRVIAAGFQNYSGQGSEFRLAADCRRPVLLQNLTVSAWYLADDPARMAWLRSNLILASDYLYDFTEGQMALGTVRVRQNYAGWDSADLKLHTSNTLRPNAMIGGIVTTETPDISPSLAISYSPGSIAMGSYWNRFGTPPNEVNTYNGVVVPPATFAADWAIALAHEFGHYLLFLFDTYTDANGQSNADVAALCTGSAMGNAYEPLNQALVFDQNHWDTACGGTEAHARLQGRTEWATIQGWYPVLTVPTTTVAGQRPGVPLTQVIFEPVAPGTEPPPLATSQIFSLTYQLDETSSGAARAFLLRNDSRLFDQGKPAKNARTVQLTDARLGDRLCVYDIDDNAAEDATPRHQFGCEMIAAGDAVLVMTRNMAWRPEVAIEQTAPQQLHVTVTQVLPPGSALFARVIPEDGGAYPAQPLAQNGAVWSGIFNLPTPVTPLFLQLWVDETPPAPATRREVVADRGTGGNGAFGPASFKGGVLVVSSDGEASYESADGEGVELGIGESIAWQSMPGTPNVPNNRFIAGQSYRLDAHPAALATRGTVSLYFLNAFGAQKAADVNVSRAIYFWNGTQWRKLPTSIVRPSNAPDHGIAENVFLASAPSQGTGIYAVLSELGGSPDALYLPLISGGR